MRKITSIACFLLIGFSLFQCAKQTQPTGGPKDETPPKLIQSNPPDRTIHFKGNQIELIFDEAIQINNPREQLLATPAIGKKFEMSAKKNKAILKLNHELQPNTTYTLSFRESIQDLSERNAAQNLKIAFSTGDYIDSLSISGTVYDILGGTPVKNFLVAAVSHTDTTDIFKHEASWITYTNEKGEFILENLKRANYILYAFEDKNKNLIVDSKSELYGFIPGMFRLDSIVSNIRIPVYKLDARPLSIISARPLTSYFNIRFTKGLDSFTLTPQDSAIDLKYIKEDPSTIKIYNTIGEADSIAARLIAIDSVENLIDTLLWIKFDKRNTPKDKFSIKSEDLSYFQNTGLLEGRITFNKPITILNYDSIIVQLDSVRTIKFEKDDFTWSEFNTSLNLSKIIDKNIDFSASPARSASAGTRETRSSSEKQEPAKPKPSYNQLIIPKGTFVSVELDTNTYTKTNIKSLTAENSGLILIEVHSKLPTITELLGSKSIERSSSLKKIRFEYLTPAEYKIRTIIDKNGNGRWDPGNYHKGTQAEPIIYYENEKQQKGIQLKANWEVGPLLITYE